MPRIPELPGQRTRGIFSEDKVNGEAAKTPRFLFQSWRKGDIDNRTHDTPTSITPRLFGGYHGLQPKQPITTMPKSLLVETATRHLNRGHGNPSYFSTWTHSWLHLSSQIKEHQRAPMETRIEDVYICIIDTVELRQQGVVVLHSSFFNEHGRISGGLNEFLAFGVISGSAYRAVSMQRIIESNALMNISVGPWPHYTDLNEAIEGAKVFGELFGPYFALPVAVTLVSFPNDRLRQSWTSPHAPSLKRVINGLAKYGVPKQWSLDTTKDHYATPDSNRASFLFDQLIARRWSSKEFPIAGMEDAFSLFPITPAPKKFLDADFGSESETSSYYPCPMTDMETRSVSGDMNVSEDVLLPPGKLDYESKMQLLKAQRQTPRYLFRGWCNSPKRPSGGHVALNNLKTIIPYAFCFGMVPHNHTIYDLGSEILHQMIYGHFKGKLIPTQFSSWASSLQVAFYWGSWGQDPCDHCHIKIVDTKAFNTDVVFVYAPTLSWLNPWFSRVEHEYLAHGVISGPGHKAIPMKAFQSIGVPVTYGVQDLGMKPTEHGALDNSIDISVEELRHALRIAKMYGGDFIVPITIATHLEEKRLRPVEMRQDAEILTYVVESGGFGEVEQMIRLMRALLHYLHGKGARGRIDRMK